MSDEVKYYTLDEALSCEPIISPPIEVEINNRRVKVCLKELSSGQLNKLRMQAVSWVEAERRKREKPGEEWRDCIMDLDVLKKERLDLLRLHAALVKPEPPHEPATTLQWIEHRLTPDVQAFLQLKLEEFQAGINPDSVTPEIVEAFEQDIKKKDIGLLWTRYGFFRAMSSAISLIENLSTSQTE